MDKAHIDSAINTASTGLCREDIVTPGEIKLNSVVKIVTNLTLNSGDGPSFYLKKGSYSANVLIVSPLPSGTNTYYMNFADVPSETNGLYLVSTTATNYSLVWSCKQVTALGATALQLISTGTTRNWSRIDAGFDPNAVRLIKIG